MFKYLAVALAFSIIVLPTLAEAKKKTRGNHHPTMSSGEPPTGAERKRQYDLAMKNCQKRFGGRLHHVEWTRTAGTHGWFCYIY